MSAVSLTSRNVLSPGQHSSFFPTNNRSHLQMNEFSWKDVTNALSLANMILGLFSIFCNFCEKSHCASWMLLISFLLDMAIRGMTRHFHICSKLGVELNDLAVFTTFGLASALLLGVEGPLNGFLAIIYVLAASFRLCFYSTGKWNPPLWLRWGTAKWEKLLDARVQ
ncbi:hypothetical protein PAL_GLEAN10004393 [Pteropus alecto]|uniref:Transmembrane protein 269 n=1 Tax=Pteropus alecto TaxID=9402 RepID=L5L8C7_PTEAL|nr:hypothetical protein PAL_GLEAN10004393 [Pteropus alecto]